MSELAKRIFDATSEDGDYTEQELIDRIDAELRPVVKFLLFIKRDIAPYDYSFHVYREEYEAFKTILQSMLPTIEEMSGYLGNLDTDYSYLSDR